ncbi:MAG: GreA/GreB family elongation factor [Myxococcaceae bacterium]|nr:GreA/GreB family elongation factor [Myxococcaceae bacterium]
MDKTSLVQQLSEKLRDVANQSVRVAGESREDAKSGAARAVNLARGTAARTEGAFQALEAVETFRPGPMPKGARIGLGSVVEIENETGGKTVFIAPAGAGTELTAPGGDGFFHVVTPVSPLGRALMGKKVGDTIDVTLKGDVVEWTISFAA